MGLSITFPPLKDVSWSLDHDPYRREYRITAEYRTKNSTDVLTHSLIVPDFELDDSPSIRCYRPCDDDLAKQARSRSRDHQRHLFHRMTRELTEAIGRRALGI